MWSWVTWVLYWSGLCVCCWCLVLQAVMNEVAKLWGSLSRVCSEVHNNCSEVLNLLLSCLKLSSLKGKQFFCT
jgi:hypothetical protein